MCCNIASVSSSSSFEVSDLTIKSSVHVELIVDCKRVVCGCPVSLASFTGKTAGFPVHVLSNSDQLPLVLLYF